MIAFQVDEFPHTWSSECFTAYSHIYPGSTGKVSTLIYFPLEPGCEDYSFLDQAVEDMEHILDSILVNSVDILELEASFDAMPSSVSSGFLWLVFSHSDNSWLQLTPISIVIHCGAEQWHYFYLYHRHVKYQPLHQFIIFPPTEAFWFQASLPSNNITFSFLIFRLALVEWLMPLWTQCLILVS